jgi:hypothetical protein
MPASHPEYDVFNKLTSSEDKQIFVRRQFLKALEEFRTRLVTKGYISYPTSSEKTFA